MRQIHLGVRIMKLKEISVKKIIAGVKEHWNTPPEGRYITYKEFAAYSIGGIGVNTINSLFGYVALNHNHQFNWWL